MTTASSLSAGGNSIGWVAEARALLLKDLRAEMRTRVAVNSVGLFAFSSLLLLALSMRELGEILGVHMLKLPLSGITLANVNDALYPAWSNASKMGLLWTLLCFAAFAGLAHSFVHEEESGTVTALRLSMPATSVYAGKLAFNVTLLSGIAVVITPFYMALTRMDHGSWFVFIVIMLAGCLGLGSTATIIAALAAKARGSGALFGAIGLPMVAVFLLLLLNAANTLFNADAAPVRVVQDVGGLVSFGVLIVSVSAITFRYVWEE